MSMVQLEHHLADPGSVNRPARPLLTLGYTVQPKLSPAQSSSQKKGVEAQARAKLESLLRPPVPEYNLSSGLRLLSHGGLSTESPSRTSVWTLALR